MAIPGALIESDAWRTTHRSILRKKRRWSDKEASEKYRDSHPSEHLIHPETTNEPVDSARHLLFEERIDT
jgi:arylamine N-acetyltransferase